MVPDRHNSKLAKTAGIYLHIPFCIIKCPYCDFYSIESGEDEVRLRDSFVNSLLTEIKNSRFKGRKINSVYFGGGTPSMLEGEQLNLLLTAIKDSFEINAVAEITLELNPGEIDIARLVSYKKSGVNRLSMGAQSFNSSELKTLGRIHQPADIISAVKLIRKAGFDNFNIDLIYGVPGQTVESVEENVHSAIKLKPNHISAYSLTYEKGTPFYQMKIRGDLTPVDENIERSMSDRLVEILRSAGYNRYEISNYSLEGYESKHNSSYWNGSPYYSFGPSAHSFDGINRWWNIRDVRTYIDRIDSNESPSAGKETLTKEQLIFERIFLNIRTTSGLHIPSFEYEFNLKFATEFEKQLSEIDNLENSDNKSLYSYTESFFRLSDKGLRFSDEIAELFAPS